MYKLERSKNQKILLEELLEDLIKVSKQLDKSPTIDEYNKNGKYESSAIIRRFGSWNKALEKANLTINNKQWSPEELFANIQNVWEKIGKQPSRRNMDDKNLSCISSGAYLRFFGTWMNALERFIEYINNADNLEIMNPPLSTKDNITHKTSRDINLRLRWLVMKRDNFKCCVCGSSPATHSNVVLHVDHVIPWSKGGETTIDNLQTLCSNCNFGKSNLL